MTEHPLALKLSSFIDLTPAEREQIEAWSAQPTHLPARKTLIRQGERPGPTCIMLDGWAYRHKDLRSGRRQIVGLLMPGDMCDLHAFLLRTTDHGIVMASDAVVALVPADEVTAGLEAHPRLMKAFWWSSLVDDGITREWLVNTGQRDAMPRLAHLFCELWTRAHRVGLTSEGALALPLSQSDLAEALGLTPVHVNRVLKMLREQGLVTFHAKHLTIPSVERLKAYVAFDPAYLQLQRRDPAKPN